MSVKKLSCPNCGTDLSSLISRTTSSVECPGCHRHIIVSIRNPRAPSASALVPRPAADDTKEEIALGEPPQMDTPGPLSMKGIHVRPLRSVSLGELQILKKVGAGALCAVYQARQRGQDRLVALKVLARHVVLRPGFVQRFYREAKVMSRLEHPNIVKLYGVGEASGLHYLAMEFVDGFTLSALQQRRGGRLGVGDALHVVLTCARALAYAHARQVVHRDIKPTNIMVNQLGHIKLADLGLAKSLDEEEDQSLTATGVGVGTPEYVAPEQAVSAKEADHRADIYSLGCVLYHLLTGRLPFQGETTIKLLRAKEAGNFPPARRFNSEVPARLDMVLDKMLAGDVKYRYQNWAELIAQLERLGLAHEHFSFNPLHVDLASTVPKPGEQMEVLLVDGNTANILLAQEVLEEPYACTNLNVVQGVAEARAFLKQAEGYTWAPRPHLILVGEDFAEGGGPELVAFIRADEVLSTIPVVILAAAGHAREVIQVYAADSELTLKKEGNFRQMREMLTAHSPGLTVAVMELPLNR